MQWRLAGVGKRLKHHRNEACVWLMSIPVRTGMYRYEQVCICVAVVPELCIFFKLDIILSYLLNKSCTLLQLTLAALSRSWSGCMRNIHVLFLVRTGTYWYVLVQNPCTCMYRYIPVQTCSYHWQYVLFCLILSRCTGFPGLAGFKPESLALGTGL